jgi:capsule polysaccharide export protein KpsE/RkpR
MQAVGTTCLPWHSYDVRWNKEKSQRFQALREAEAEGRLTERERVELARLIDEFDTDEADDLRPVMEQAAARVEGLKAEKARLGDQIDALSRIAAEQERLLSDATAYLQRLRERSAALTEDYRRLMGRELVPAR